MIVESNIFSPAEEADVCVFLLPPDVEQQEEREKIRKTTNFFAAYLPVVFVIADLTERVFQIEKSKDANIRYLHVSKEYGPSQSGLLNLALLSAGYVEPMLWLRDTRFQNFFIHRFSPYKIYDLVKAEVIPELLACADIVIGKAEALSESILSQSGFRGAVVNSSVSDDAIFMKSMMNSLHSIREVLSSVMKQLTILVLYDARKLSDECVLTDLHNMSRFSIHRIFFSNVALGQECRIHLSHFDAVLIHHCVDVCDEASFSLSFSRAFKRFGGYKGKFGGASRAGTPAKGIEWIMKNGVNGVFIREQPLSDESLVLHDSSLNKLSQYIDIVHLPQISTPEEWINRIDRLLADKIRHGANENLENDILEVLPGIIYDRDFNAGLRQYPINAIRDEEVSTAPTQVETYWGQHTVYTRRFKTVEDSLENLRVRSEQYPLFVELMELYGAHDNEIILDYGCGPGNDLIGFLLYSKAARVIGMDISLKSLTLAAARLALHHADPSKIMLFQASDKKNLIPLEDESVDYIHSGGVLHHTSDPTAILREFRRILKPGRIAQVMVYNKNSLWYHLYTAYYKMILQGEFIGLDVDEAFSRNTDGEYCPIARCYKPEEFISLCNESGLSAIYRGGYLSRLELDLMATHRELALEDPRLASEHREFLEKISMDDARFPLYEGQYAGIGGVYSLKKQ